MTVAGERRPPAGFDIPLSYFRGLARKASSALIESGKLVEGELFEYLVLAYQREDQPAAAGGERPRAIAIRPVGQTLEVSDRPMEPLLATSSPCGSSPDGLIPVFIPGQVIEEAVELMLRANDKETGGILIGHLRRDPGRGLFWRSPRRSPPKIPRWRPPASPSRPPPGRPLTRRCH